MLMLKEMCKCRVVLDSGDGSDPFQYEYQSTLLDAKDMGHAQLFDNDWSTDKTESKIEIYLEDTHEWVDLDTVMAAALIEAAERYGFTEESDNDGQIVLYTGYHRVSDRITKLP